MACCSHDLPGPVQILFEARPKSAVIAERVHCPRWHSVDRVGADQLLDIEHVAVFGILGAGARPKQPLRARALGTELLPARPGEETLVALIRQLGVCDRHLAADAGEGIALGIVVGLAQPRLDEPVDSRVDAADEEAGDTRDPVRIAATRDEVL